MRKKGKIRNETKPPGGAAKERAGEENVMICQPGGVGGTGGPLLTACKTGCVNKEFQGVAPLKPKYGKPQSQIRISHRCINQRATQIH